MAGVVQQARRFGASLLFDWRLYPVVCTLVLCAEALLGLVVVGILPSRYTEIDWTAYMQEVEGWVVDGELDYTKLRGDTGPLVYPGGFMHLYRGLRWLAGDSGRGPAAIRRMQWVFLGLYLVTQALVLAIYGKAKAGPPWLALLLPLSKRLHSLYYLRLFNDCWAMLGHYAAVLLAMHHAWLPAVLAWSLGLSVKMNGLLFLPALGLLLLRNTGILRTTVYLTLALALQAALGLPFLSAHPVSYLRKAFELDRVFLHTWTVNWKFLDPRDFTSGALAKGLLAAHLLTLLAFAHWAWCRWDGGLTGTLRAVLRNASWGTGTAGAAAAAAGGAAGTLAAEEEAAREAALDSTLQGLTGHAGAEAEKALAHLRRRREEDKAAAAAAAAAASSSPPTRASPGAFRDSAAFIAYCLLGCNFVGLVFARTLHYQFYAWYWHALPFLLWRTDLALPIRLLLLSAIEVPFNVGDASGAATPLSSAVLQSAHLLLLASLLIAGVMGPAPGASGASADVGVPHPRLGAWAEQAERAAQKREAAGAAVQERGTAEGPAALRGAAPRPAAPAASAGSAAAVAGAGAGAAEASTAEAAKDR